MDYYIHMYNFIKVLTRVWGNTLHNIITFDSNKAMYILLHAKVMCYKSNVLHNTVTFDSNE